MIKFKKVIDERQELELLSIERSGFWVVFGILFIAYLVQSFFFDASFKQLIGEYISLCAGMIVILVGCIRKGLWSCYSIPNLKNYFLYSFVTAIIFSLINAVILIIKSSKDILLPMLISGFSTFIGLFLLFLIFGGIIKNRRDK